MAQDYLTQLLDDLKSGDSRRQLDAVRRCARLHVRDTLMPLLALLNSPDAEVRAAALWAVDALRDEAALPRLVAALDDPDFFVRSAAGWSLVHLGVAVVPAVGEVVVQSANPDARQMAALVLERIDYRASSSAAHATAP